MAVSVSEGGLHEGDFIVLIGLNTVVVIPRGGMGRLAVLI